MESMLISHPTFMSLEQNTLPLAENLSILAVQPFIQYFLFHTVTMLHPLPQFLHCPVAHNAKESPTVLECLTYVLN